MIKEYFRPESLEDALQLITRDAVTLPMGGGTLINSPHSFDFAVADLQALNLTSVDVRGKFLEVGGGLSLQSLLESNQTPPGLKETIQLEATRNLRQQATIAGALVTADGRSPFACAMLALDSQLIVQPGEINLDYGQLLHSRLGIEEGLPRLSGQLITMVKLNMGIGLAYEYVARSPADRPIAAVAAAAWPSGRLRIVVGGWGQAPRLALDAPEASGIEEAVRSAFAEAADDWGSAEYRQAVGVKLALRAFRNATK